MKKKIIIYSMLTLLVASGFYYKTKEPVLIPIELTKIAPIGDSTYFKSMAALGFKDKKISNIISYVKNREYWSKQFGLKFIGEDEMNKFLDDNSFIVGPASNFKPSVPVEAGRRIISEYERISNFSASYTLTLTHNNLNYSLSKNDLVIVPKLGETLNWVDYVSGTSWAAMTRLIKPEAMDKYHIVPSDFFTLTQSNSGVLIIANSSEFKTEGMDLINRILSRPLPKDPIAILKVQDGYVELASWQ